MSDGGLLGRLVRRPWSVALLVVVIALLGVAPMSARSGIFGTANGQAITVTKLEPADGSTVAAGQVTFAAFLDGGNSSVDWKNARATLDGTASTRTKILAWGRVSHPEGRASSRPGHDSAWPSGTAPLGGGGLFPLPASRFLLLASCFPV